MDDKPSIELQAAMKPLKLKVLPRLTEEQLSGLIALYARGYTARRIAKEMLSQYSLVLTDPQILYGGVLFAEEVDKLRREMAETNLTTGLARRSERVRRLSEIAEAFEPDAVGRTVTGDNGITIEVPPSSKAAGVVMKAYDQIAEEMVEVGLKEEIVQEDPWYNIMKKLATAPQLSQNQDSVEALPPPQNSSTSSSESSD